MKNAARTFFALTAAACFALSCTGCASRPEPYESAEQSHGAISSDESAANSETQTSVFGRYDSDSGRKAEITGGVETLAGKLYSMDISGDFAPDILFDAGGVSSDEEFMEFLRTANGGKLGLGLIPQEFACSTLSAVNSAGGGIFGRNFDWAECSAVIVNARPKEGYASVSTAAPDFFDYGGKIPSADEESFNELALALYYTPLDGMNEKGLCVADLILMGTDTVTDQRTDKPDITTTVAIRLLLEQAATVDEAVELLSRYDMHSSSIYMHHLAVSDATGKSVAIEYVNDVMHVTETPALTNFFISEGDIPITDSGRRYTELMRRYENSGGVMEFADMVRAMQAVSMGNIFPQSACVTVWTVIYDQSARTAEFYFGRDYGKAYKLSVREGFDE